MSASISVYNSVMQRLVNTTSRLQARLQELENRVENKTPCSSEPLPVYNGSKKESDLHDELEALAQRVEYIESNTHDMTAQLHAMKDTCKNGMSAANASVQGGGGKENFTKMEEFVQTKIASLKSIIEALSMTLREDIDDIKIDRKLLKERVDVSNHNAKTANASMLEKLNDLSEKFYALSEKVNMVSIRQNTLEKNMSETPPVAPAPAPAPVPPPAPAPAPVTENQDKPSRTAGIEHDILKDLDHLTHNTHTPESSGAIPPGQDDSAADSAARRRVNRRKKPIE